jgi:hypothetical protein
LSSFQAGVTKLERFLPKNQHTQRKLFNFENWVRGEVSKIGQHFRKESDLKIDLKYQKMSITKNVLLNCYSSMKKKMRKIPLIFDIKN